MLTGIAVFLILATAGLAGEIRLIEKLRVTPANDWLADHVYLPALRMPALIGFVLGAYPALFGLESAPALASLLDFNWFGRALNLLFILPLLVSLAPVAGRFSAIALPIQGIALISLLYLPLQQAMPAAHAVQASHATGWFAVIAFAYAGHALGNFIAERLPRHDLEQVTYDALVLLFQAPLLFSYGRMLGARL